ncbi:MAG: STAS domain-containing protein [Vampirovibrionales bacterium]
MTATYPTASLGLSSGTEALHIQVQSPVDSQTLQSTLEGALAQQPFPAGVVVDLSAVDFIESSGLGGLVALHKRCQQVPVPVVFLSPQAYVLKLMTITRLDKVLILADSMAEVDSKLQNSPSAL